VFGEREREFEVIQTCSFRVALLDHLTRQYFFVPLGFFDSDIMLRLFPLLTISKEKGEKIEEGDSIFDSEFIIVQLFPCLKTSKCQLVSFSYWTGGTPCRGSSNSGKQSGRDFNQSQLAYRVRTLHVQQHGNCQVQASSKWPVLMNGTLQLLLLPFSNIFFSLFLLSLKSTLNF
jgi:hypothetical protein